MALYSCSDCGHDYSSKAFACPGCGKMGARSNVVGNDYWMGRDLLSSDFVLSFRSAWLVQLLFVWCAPASLACCILQQLRASAHRGDLHSLKILIKQQVLHGTSVALCVPAVSSETGFIHGSGFALLRLHLINGEEGGEGTPITAALPSLGLHHNTLPKEQLST